MAVKYVKDFVFGPMTSVQRYAKGGHVTKLPAKAKPAAKGMPSRAKPNAPARGAKRMESAPKVGKGQGYKDGGKVPGREMDRLPTKTPPGRGKDLAPAKPFKGAYEGYAKGGKARRYAEGGDVDGDNRYARMMPGDGSPLESALERSPYRPVDELLPIARDISISPYEGRVDPGAVEPVAYEPGAGGSGGEPTSGLRDLMRGLIGMERPEEPPMARAVRDVGEGRRVGLGDIMRAARAQRPQMQDRIPAPYMPTMRDISREESDAYMKSIGKTPSPQAMYAKGGHVKGQAKVGKVMGEYKRGELHSGSKKGPLVKNPKQAVAIALSEARKAGAKIPKKEEGGLMASKPEVRKPKSVTVTKVTKTVSDNAKDAALNEQKMLEFLRSLPKDEIAEMMEKRAMQAPAMDPDMPKYRRGGVARKGVPAHKGKAMYGGGKC